MMKKLITFFVLFPVFSVFAQSTDVLAPWEGGPEYYKQWKNGPPSDTTFFPINVWLQNPLNKAHVQQFKQMHINTYIGLWNGPTEAQLKAIADNDIYVMCLQNPVALQSPYQKYITAWTQVDEPDHVNVETKKVVMPDEIQRRYQEMKRNDTSRPVYLNLAQGVASDYAFGRGPRTNHPEDYPEYVKGADILGYDIYPANIRQPIINDPPFKKRYYDDVGQKPWIVATAIDRLRAWSEYKKPVWAWIECTNFNSVTPFGLTPKLVKAEVWMALTHGARGIGYFTHILKPAPVRAAGIFEDPEMVRAVTAINLQIKNLAPVLNKPTVTNGVTVTSFNAEAGIHYMLKRQGGATWLFVVSDRMGIAKVNIKFNGFPGERMIEVVDENRTIKAIDGGFTDVFRDFDVHIYKIK